MLDVSVGILISFCITKELSSFICNIPDSITVLLMISGSEFILPLITRNFVDLHDGQTATRLYFFFETTSVQFNS